MSDSAVAIPKKRQRKQIVIPGVVSNEKEKTKSELTDSLIDKDNSEELIASITKTIEQSILKEMVTKSEFNVMFKQQWDNLDAHVKEIPSIILAAIEKQQKDRKAAVAELSERIIAKPQKCASFSDFKATLLQVITDLDLNKTLASRYSKLHTAQVAHSELIKQNKANNTNNMITLDLDNNIKDQETYELLLNFNKSLTTDSIKTKQDAGTEQQDAVTKQKDADVGTKRKRSTPNIYRVEFLAFIFPIWKNDLILNFFKTESSITTTYLSDIKAPDAFYSITQHIGTAIYNYLGFKPFESYLVKKLGKEEVKVFSLPSEKDHQNLIFQRIEDHFHQKRRKKPIKDNDADDCNSHASSSSSSTSQIENSTPHVSQNDSTGIRKPFVYSSSSAIVDSSLSQSTTSNNQSPPVPSTFDFTSMFED